VKSELIIILLDVTLTPEEKEAAMVKFLDDKRKLLLGSKP